MDLGFGIRDPRSGIQNPGSGINLFRIPDPGVKKAPDPGSGSATLLFTVTSTADFTPPPPFEQKWYETGL